MTQSIDDKSTTATSLPEEATVSAAVAAISTEQAANGAGSALAQEVAATAVTTRDACVEDDVDGGGECHRPSYIWAQNRTHLFVTIQLEPAELAHKPCPLTLGPEAVRLHVRGGETASRACSDVHLVLYRSTVTDQSYAQPTRRGLLLQLRKRAAAHWPRLLLREVADGRQGVDWARWNHPDAERAVQRESRLEQFGQLDEARARTIGRLRPRFDALLLSFKEAHARGLAMAPEEQEEMLRCGEVILKHFREEREQRQRLLGDAPLPAGVDETKLERALVRLREHERKGSLKYDRNTESWVEWRRRQKQRQRTSERRAKALERRRQKAQAQTRAELPSGPEWEETATPMLSNKARQGAGGRRKSKTKRRDK